MPEFDLVLTAGADDNPNHLPQGFLADRQRNRRHSGTLTLFFNHAVMHGAAAVIDRTTQPLDVEGEPCDVVLDIASNRPLCEKRAVLTPRGSLVCIGNSFAMMEA